MKKIIILLVAVLLCCSAVFAGCTDKTGYSNNLTINASDAVSSNGGFAVVKGDYLYYINGVETNTADNTYGDVVTGALVRTKIAELANPAEAKPEMVIPALFVAGDMTSGFYMYGANVYYASPSTTKNKEGVVENSKLDFVKTSLDGKTSTTIKTVDDKATVYRFVEASGVVYLILKTVNEDSETVIQIINANDGKEVIVTEKIENVIFTDGGNGAEVYYTRIAHDDVLDQDESYNEIHRVTVEGKDEILLSGKGQYGNAEGDETGFGVSGAKFTLIKDTADTLYFSAAYVDTSITSVTRYYAVKKADLAGPAGEEEADVASAITANQAKIVLLNEGTASASTVFATNSYYKDVNTIVYLDATHGIVKYDYATTDASAVDGRIRLFYDKDLVAYTVKFWQDGYLYLADASNYYYRVNVDALLDADTTNDNVSVEKINFLANSTSWYAPEVVGEYFISVYTADPYNSLVYVSNITANSALSEEEIEAIQESTEEQVTANLATSISIISEAIQEKIDTYMEDTFGEEE